MRLYSDASQNGFGHDDANRVPALVESSSDAQARRGGRVANKFHCRLTANEWTTPPVLSDLREEAVLDLVPLARAWREMADADVQTGGVGEALQLDTPEVRTRTVAPTTICGDQEFFGLGICLLSHLTPPAFECCDGEFCSVVIHADADPRLVTCGVVDTVRNHFAQALVDEVVDAHRLRMTLRMPFATSILEIAHQLLLLRVDRNYWLTALHEPLRRRVDMLELRVPVGRLIAFAGLAYDLQAVAKIVQKKSHLGRADGVTHRHKFLRKLRLALRRPA